MRIIGGVLALLSSIALAGGLYLAFVFPKTIALWQQQGMALSTVQKSLVLASRAFTGHGLMLFPLLAMGLIVGAVMVVQRSE